MLEYFTVNGDFTQQSTGTLVMKLDSASVGLQVNGTASLAGTLQLLGGRGGNNEGGGDYAPRQQQSRPAPQQAAPRPAPQPAAQQPAQDFDSFDDDIPF